MMKPRDFYGRQLKDWKGSAEIEQMVPRGMATYGTLCGWTLARAHARSGDRIAIASYLGNGDSFDRAMLEFSKAYAEQNERDYQALAAAVKSGRITAEHGSLMCDRVLGELTSGRRQRRRGIRLAAACVLRRERWGSSSRLTALRDRPNQVMTASHAGLKCCPQIANETMDGDLCAGALMSSLDQSRLPIVGRPNRPRWIWRESCDG